MEANSAKLQHIGADNRADGVCQRMQEGCPVGWNQQSGVCYPPSDYSGPCHSMLIDESVAMSVQCNVSGCLLWRNLPSKRPHFHASLLCIVKEPPPRDTI
eukprot:Protomagalhaensia_sp_Gyna_25__4932@NODE_52_length_6070_cov_248_257005_g39_i0_p11_GENE_NODE_52_length_6070_cov_248_257005_g39_i0NODE_52_length_6070_cov_248_257005_g39_i0_p11_ORF_typecomplete_len100_score2_26CPW_WPC/PF09717_10/9_7e07zfCW/PF07496_15/2_6e03zfCW/PF07496_15/0_13_NODE_52_length_6070_cov_248_257005_g39_i031393438